MAGSGVFPRVPPRAVYKLEISFTFSLITQKFMLSKFYSVQSRARVYKYFFSLHMHFQNSGIGNFAYIASLDCNQ